jgi:ubiquinol-cytochrome c reductase iron-sulfur subunit
MSNDSHTPVSLRTVDANDPRLQPAARNPKLVERWIAICFVLAMVCGVLFIYSYIQQTKPWTLGATLGGASFFLGVGLVAWGKYLMPRGPFVEERHSLASSQVERDAMAAALVERGGGAFGRRKMLGGLFVGGVGIFGLAALIPGLRSLGPNPGTTLQTTDWKSGVFLVDQSGRRIQSGDLAVGSVVTVFPEGTQDSTRGQAVDQTILIRLSNADYTTRKGRETWGPMGYVAYSKLCTHLGCPVGLYEQQLQLLVCPCHQSMFDVTNGAEPNFGPAPRPLPQLPLYIDASGYLRAQSGYHEAVGPGFWERS